MRSLLKSLSFIQLRKHILHNYFEIACKTQQHNKHCPVRSLGDIEGEAGGGGGDVCISCVFVQTHDYMHENSTALPLFRVRVKVGVKGKCTRCRKSSLKGSILAITSTLPGYRVRVKSTYWTHTVCTWLTTYMHEHILNTPVCTLCRPGQQAQTNVPIPSKSSIFTANSTFTRFQNWAQFISQLSATTGNHTYCNLNLYERIFVIVLL